MPFRHLFPHPNCNFNLNPALSPFPDWTLWGSTVLCLASTILLCLNWKHFASRGLLKAYSPPPCFSFPKINPILPAAGTHQSHIPPLPSPVVVPKMHFSPYVYFHVIISFNILFSSPGLCIYLFPFTLHLAPSSRATSSPQVRAFRAGCWALSREDSGSRRLPVGALKRRNLPIFWSLMWPLTQFSHNFSPPSPPFHIDSDHLPAVSYLSCRFDAFPNAEIDKDPARQEAQGHFPVDSPRVL